MVHGAERRLIEGDAEHLTELESRLFSILIPQRQKDAIQIDDPAFSSYDPEEKQRDLQSVQERKREFERKNAGDPLLEQAAVDRGKVYEAIIEFQISHSDWLGPNAEVVVPSEYDDIFGKLDGLVRLNAPDQVSSGIEDPLLRPDVPKPSHLALSIDITTNAGKIGEKFAGIRRSIERGTLSKMKYFTSPHMTGPLELLPQVVIGADRKTMMEVAELLLSFRMMQQAGPSRDPERPKRFKKIRDSLAEHPMQFKIIYEIQIQLEAFSAYAKSINQDEVAAVYDHTRKIIAGILREKSPPAGREDFEHEDSVYRTIAQYARELTRSSKSPDLAAA